jgi:NAD-dependent deacetylase
MDKLLGADLDRAVKYFRTNSRIIVLTGAGISAESGVPTFRGKGGLWEKYDPEVVATEEAMRLRPEKVWEMHNELRQVIAKGRPNQGHIAIAELEDIFENVTVVTQNVDNYHQDAGSSNVLELHGNAWRVKCTVENKIWEDRTVPYKVLPPSCSCGAMLRPDVVFFGEPLDRDIIDRAISETSLANIILVVGTSYVVYPAAYLPVIAKETGCAVIDINTDLTPITNYSDVFLLGKSGEILPELVIRLKNKIKK